MKYSLALAMALVATPALAQFPNVTRAGTPYFYGTGGISLRQERVPLSYGMDLSRQVSGRPSTLRIQVENRNPPRIQKGLSAYDVLLHQYIIQPQRRRLNDR